MVAVDDDGVVYVCDAGNSRVQVFAAGETRTPVEVVTPPARPQAIAVRLGRLVVCASDHTLALYEKRNGAFARKAELPVGAGAAAAALGPAGEIYVAFNSGPDRFGLKKYGLGDDGSLRELAVVAPSYTDQWPNFFPGGVPMCSAPDGHIWIAADIYSKLLRLDPKTDRIEEFPSPMPRSVAVAFGPDGVAYVGGYYDQKATCMIMAGPAAELGQPGWGRAFPRAGAFDADQGACLGMLPDSDGGVYMRVIEQGYQKGWPALAFKKVFPDGKMKPLADYGSLYAVRRKFNGAPYTMAFDKEGNIILAALPLTSVLKMDAAGKTIWEAWLHPQGGADRIAFAGPTDMALDGKGNIWVADGDADKVFCLSTSGKLLLEFGGYGNVDVVDGSGFDHPTGIATARVDGGEYLYVGDAGNHRIVKYRIVYGIAARNP